MKSNDVKNATLGLIILTFVSKVLGFVREIAISYMYGASAMSDAYSMANSIAVLVVTGLAMGVMTAYIPESMLITEQNKKNEFTSNLINFMLVVFGLISIFCILFVKPIVTVLGSGFSDKTKTYTEILLSFVLLASICIFIIYIISGFLNIHNNFYYNGVQLIITNSIIIIAVIFSEENPVKLGIGYLTAYIVPLILGAFLMKYYKFSYMKKLDLKDKHLKNVCAVSIIAFLGTNVVKLNVMLDRVFASSLQEGAVAAINYAFTLTSIVPEVFALSMITVLYPELSELFVKNEFKLFGKKVTKLLAQTTIILIPVMVIFLAEGDWIVRFLFERGAFDETATDLTVQVLRGYSIGMLPIGISFILCKVFFARKEEMIPTICFGISIVLNFLFDAVTAGQTLIELTSFTTISIAVATIAMFIILVKKQAISEVGRMANTFFKSIFSGVVMAVLIGIMRKYCMYVFLKNGTMIRFLVLAAVTLVAGLAYLLIMFILREETLLNEVDRIKIKFTKQVKR